MQNLGIQVDSLAIKTYRLVYYNKDLIEKLSFYVIFNSKVYLTAILAAIFNFSKGSMIPARHHADPYSTWLPLPKSTQICGLW